MKVDEYKQMETEIQQGLVMNFENLLGGKTITQEQANKIKAVLNKVRATKKVNFIKTKTVNEQGCKIYMNSNEINHINLLKDLVDNGKITKDQAKKIIMKEIYLCQIKWSINYFESLFRKD